MDNFEMLKKSAPLENVINPREVFINKGIELIESLETILDELETIRKREFLDEDIETYSILEKMNRDTGEYVLERFRINSIFKVYNSEDVPKTFGENIEEERRFIKIIKGKFEEELERMFLRL